MVWTFRPSLLIILNISITLITIIIIIIIIKDGKQAQVLENASTQVMVAAVEKHRFALKFLPSPHFSFF